MNDVIQQLYMVGSHERTARLSELMREGLIPLDKEDPLYREAILATWDGSPDPHFHHEFWEVVLPRHDPITNDEDALAALPNTLTVMRGSEGESIAKAGFSWTLQRRTATIFALHQPLFGSYMHPRDKGVVVTGTLNKEHIAMYLTGRSEDEVVIHPYHWDYIDLTEVKHVTREDLAQFATE
jgi:hypothetical protein